jgi:PAS domain S-box-containing protein
VDKKSLVPEDIVERVRWYVRLRWFFLLAVAVPALLSLYVGEGLSAQLKRDTVTAVMAVSSNLLFFILAQRCKRAGSAKALAGILLLLDVVLVTYLIYTKGGTESRSPILYTIPILMSAPILGRRGVYQVAMTSILFYDLLIIGDYLGWIQTIGAVNPALRSSFPYMLNTVAFFTSILFIIAALADFTMSLLMKKEQEAKDSSMALREAQRIAKIGSWSWDLENNRASWSEEMFIILGLHRDELKPGFQSYLESISAAEKKKVEKAIHQAIKSQQPFTIEHESRKPDGQTIVIHCEGHVASDESGKPSRLYGIAQDITSQYRAKRELEKRTSDLEKLNSAMVNRELKMVELKKKLAELSGGEGRE